MSAELLYELQVYLQETVTNYKNILTSYERGKVAMAKELLDLIKDKQNKEVME